MCVQRALGQGKLDDERDGFGVDGLEGVRVAGGVAHLGGGQLDKGGGQGQRELHIPGLHDVAVVVPLLRRGLCGFSCI